MPTIRAYLPVLMLLYAATYWGLVWLPLRLLADAGMAGVWQTLVSYAAAFAAGWLLLTRGRWHLGVRRHAGLFALLVLANGWTNVAFVLAMLEGTVVRVLLLFYLSPVWTALLARFVLAERLNLTTLLTLPVGLAGAVLMLWHPALLSTPLAPADWLAASAGFGFALSNVLARRLWDVRVRDKTLLAWLGVVLISVLAVAVTGEPVPQVEPAVWGWAVVLGVLGFMLSTLAVVYGVSHLPAQRSAVILLFEILVGAVSAWAIAGELMSLREWLGGGLILLAGFIAATHRGDRSRR